MSYEREYYKDINIHPLIFYVVFGIKDEELNLSKSRYNVEEIPEGLKIRILTKDKNEEYMESLIGKSIGKMMEKDNPELYEKIKTTNMWAIINGEIVKDSTLDYIKNTVGIVQAILETGAIGVFDLQTLSLYSPDGWTNKIFSKEFNPCSHVKILLSDMDNDKSITWLHTRGVRKFGRPDISIENIKESDLNDAIDIANQMIYYSSKGAFFENYTKLHTSKNKTFIVKPSIINDNENPDFNNIYYKILWDECELIE